MDYTALLENLPIEPEEEGEKGQAGEENVPSFEELEGFAAPGPESPAGSIVEGQAEEPEEFGDLDSLFEEAGIGPTATEGGPATPETGTSPSADEFAGLEDFGEEIGRASCRERV
jgi:hypothetical protein